MQTRKQSLVESIVSTVIAFITGVILQVIVFPFYGVHVDTVTNMEIAIIFTICAVIRTYLIRRLFVRLGSG